MATVLQVTNMRSGYVDVVNHVLEYGTVSAPRGLSTIEITDVTIEVADPTDCLPVGVERKLSTKIAAVEALQLIGGFSDPALVLKASPAFAEFMDGDKFWGSYGDRIGAQAFEVVRKLRHDPDSRQALITLWDPGLDNMLGKHDYPCTTSMHFLIRGGRLHMYVTMRSNDVWRGLAYDAFQFTQLQLTLCNELECMLGTYSHRAISLHLYEEDLEAAQRLHRPVAGLLPNRPLGFVSLHRPRRLVQEGDPPLTVTEEWYMGNVR